MLEKLNVNGQGCCELCCIFKGWHRDWTYSLFHVKNKCGLVLRKQYHFYPSYFFSNDSTFPAVTLCYAHALQVEESRKHFTDYERGYHNNG